MLSNEFINEIVAENTMVINATELEELEYNTIIDPEGFDGVAFIDYSAATIIEDLEYSGFTARDIKQLFEGRFIKDGGMWGMIPHKASLYTSYYKDYYILIIEVAGQ